MKGHSWQGFPPFHPHYRTTTVKYRLDTKGKTRIARDDNGNNVVLDYSKHEKEIVDLLSDYFKR